MTFPVLNQIAYIGMSIYVLHWLTSLIRENWRVRTSKEILWSIAAVVMIVIGFSHPIVQYHAAADGHVYTIFGSLVIVITALSKASICTVFWLYLIGHPWPEARIVNRMLRDLAEEHTAAEQAHTFRYGDWDTQLEGVCEVEDLEQCKQTQVDQPAPQAWIRCVHYTSDQRSDSQSPKGCGHYIRVWSIATERDEIQQS